MTIPTPATTIFYFLKIRNYCSAARSYHNVLILRSDNTLDGRLIQIKLKQYLLINIKNGGHFLNGLKFLRVHKEGNLQNRINFLKKEILFLSLKYVTLSFKSIFLNVALFCSGRSRLFF